MPRHKKGGRGVYVKDLGNFQYERREDLSEVARRPAAPRQRVDPVVLKRAFMLQNYQFVLRRDVQERMTTQGLPQRQRRLRETLSLSDTAPSWDTVTAVVVRGTLEECQCPICLETPIAARVADCGHAFCLPCMLQYLSRLKEEKKQRSCPVCHNFLTSSMLRPCILRSVESISVGKRASFTLLRRRSTCCVLLRGDDNRWNDTTSLEDDLTLPFLDEPSAVFGRFIFETTESEDARRSLDCTSIMDRLSDIQAQPRPFTQFEDEVQRFLEEALNTVLHESTPQSVQSDAQNSPPIAPKRPSVDMTTTYDLYGESGGQPYYMHPITFKMLREDAKTRGTSIPNVLEAPVEEVITFTQDEASRKHYKPFAHVPIYGTVKLCLLDLTDVVLPSTLKAFESSVSGMRRARQQREAANDSSGEDTSWQAYLRRYRAVRSTSSTESGLLPECAPSDFSGTPDCLPLLEPSLESSVTAWGESGGPSGDAALTTRQRETKQQAVPVTSRWLAEDSRRLFATPSIQPVLSTWGGRVLNFHNASSAGSFTAEKAGQLGGKGGT